MCAIADMPIDDRAEPRDVLSLVLDSLDIRCPWVGKTDLTAQGTTGLCDQGPVFYSVLGGHCRLYLLDEETVDLAEGDLLVLPRGGAHLLAASESASACAGERPTIDMAACSAVGRPLAGARLLMGYIEYASPRLHPLCHELPTAIQLKDGHRNDRQPILAGALQAIRFAITAPVAGAAALLNLLGQLVVAEAIRTTLRLDAASRPERLLALTDGELASALAPVYRDPAHPWSLDVLAREAGMSRSSFARRFKLLMAVSPMTWVVDLRMRLACRLLRDRSLSLKQVALNVGYTTPAAFSAAFRRWAGQAPSECRAALDGNGRSHGRSGDGSGNRSRLT